MHTGCWISNGGFTGPNLPFDLAANHTLEVSVTDAMVSVAIDPPGSPTLVARPGEPASSFGISTSVRDTHDPANMLSVFAMDAKVQVSSVQLTRPLASQGKLTLDVTGMHCEMCEATIQSALEKLPGVRKVTSSYKTGRVEADIDPAAPPSNIAIIRAIESLKYSAKVHDAPPGGPR